MHLYPHQQQALERTKNRERIAFYHDPGMGKTYTGSEAMYRMNRKVNLVICQKSKVQDWLEHFYKSYSGAFDLTKKRGIDSFMKMAKSSSQVTGVINYELVFRRPKLLALTGFALMLDESSMIQNDRAKRTKFILKMKPASVILLSGTPTSGKYEKLWSQCHLLGWPISKRLFYEQYIITEIQEFGGMPVRIVTGYKNIDRLKAKLKENGADFLKADEVLSLPKMNDVIQWVDTIPEYKKMLRRRYVKFKDGTELIGGTALTRHLYLRMLCGQYNRKKLQAFSDLLSSTDDRIIVFYNFNAELEALKRVCIEQSRTVSQINGSVKNLSNYEAKDNSVTLIQYQAGSLGLNLQKANKVIYFTPPERSELFEQSKKRIHRMGQKRPCFYFYLMCRRSIETRIYNTLRMRHDYTDELFKKEYEEQ